MSKKKKKKKSKIRYSLMMVSGLNHVFKFNEPWLRAEASEFYPNKDISKDEAMELISKFPEREWYDCANGNSTGFCISTDEEIKITEERMKDETERAKIQRKQIAAMLDAGAFPFLLNQASSPSRQEDISFLERIIVDINALREEYNNQDNKGTAWPIKVIVRYTNKDGELVDAKASPFLTVKAAKDYMERDAHNLNNPTYHIEHIDEKNYELRALLEELGLKTSG